MLERLHQASRLEEGGGHSLAFTENSVWWGWRATFGGQTGRPWQPWQRFGELFFFFPKGNGNTLKSWSRELTWPDLLYWKSILQNTMLRRVFTPKVKERWRERSKIQLGPLPPTPSICAHRGFYSTYFLYSYVWNFFFSSLFRQIIDSE